MNASTITIAGRRLEAQYLTGEPGYPVLVLLHEGLGSVALWKNVPQELVRRTGCPVLAYSRYGNGFSEVLQEPRRPSYLHDEALVSLPAVLQAFRIDDVLLLGHSDGASIALIAAEKMGAQLRAIVAQAPHVFVEQLSVESIARAKFAFETGNLRERMTPYHQDVDRTFYGWNDIWLDPAFRAWDIRDVLPGICVPVLLIQGTDDEYGTGAQLDAIRNLARNARVDSLLLGRCGHSPHRDRPQLTLDAVAAFVRSVL